MKKILSFLSVCCPLLLTAQTANDVPTIRVSTKKTETPPSASTTYAYPIGITCYGFLECGVPTTNFKLNIRDYYPDSLGLLKVARIISYKAQAYHSELLNNRRPINYSEFRCEPILETFYTNYDTISIRLSGHYSFKPDSINQIPLLAFCNIEAELIDGKKVYLQDFTVTQLTQRAKLSTYVPFEKYYESNFQYPNDPKRRYDYKVIGHLKNNDVTVQYARYGKCRLLFSFDEYTHFDFTDISYNNNGKKEKVPEFTYQLPKTK